MTNERGCFDHFKKKIYYFFTVTNISSLFSVVFVIKSRIRSNWGKFSLWQFFFVTSAEGKRRM